MVNNYYKKNKEKLWKEARERYQNLYEEEKEKNVSVIVIEIRVFLKKKAKVECMKLLLTHKK